MARKTARERIMGRKFKEGEYYSFIVGKKISIEEGEDFISVTDPWGKKHLLPFSRFRKYKFEEGRNIFLKVEKINCQGKVFFEPPHPCHSEGEISKFKINRVRKHQNSFGEDEWIAAVEDCLGFETEVPISNDMMLNPDELIECRIERIEKGQVFLIPTMFDYAGNLDINSTYIFEIERVRTFSEREFFILNNQLCHNLRLRLKFCKGLSFKPGQQIECSINLFSNGILFPDPKHPYYQYGEIYEFEIIDDSQIIGDEEESHPALEVRDKFGNKHLVQIPEFTKNLLHKHTIECRVNGFSRGKLSLQFIH
jgi:hypothetical protein